MRELIYKDDAIRIANGYCHPANIAKELAKLPAVEPEIIRCKDCKYHGYEHSKIGDIPYCSNIDYGYGWKDNDFRSQAERREE